MCRWHSWLHSELKSCGNPAIVPGVLLLVQNASPSKGSAMKDILIKRFNSTCAMHCLPLHETRQLILRTFARKSSTVDFLIKLLLQLGYELLLSEMQNKWGVTDFVSEIRYLKGHPNFEKSVFLTRYGSSVCMPKNVANESLEHNFPCQFLSGSIK